MFQTDDVSLMVRAFRNPVTWGIIAAIFALIVLGLIMSPKSHARDLDGRYAASPLKPWFDTLKSAKGLCCSDADGFAVSDPDWETKGGHYRVRLDGQWVDVPDDAVITEPNRAGKTMVWPVYYNDSVARGTIRTIEIRCFLPGSMT